MVSAGGHLGRESDQDLFVGLQPGGKSAVIVYEDAPIEQGASHPLDPSPSRRGGLVMDVARDRDAGTIELVRR